MEGTEVHHHFDSVDSQRLSCECRRRTLDMHTTLVHALSLCGEHIARQLVQTKYFGEDAKDYSGQLDVKSS